MKHLVKKSILEITPYVPGKPIEEVKRELGLKSVIKLASNENPYGPSPKALDAIKKASEHLNRYPDGNCYYLRQELSKRLKISPPQLIFGNGSDEIIVLAVRTFVQDADEVVIALPSFLIYDIASRIAGATIKAVDIKNDRYDLEGMKRAVTKKTKIIFLGNPDNPIGRPFSKKEITWFLKDLRSDILVFVDEAYFEYVDEPDYVDSIKMLETYPNILVARTFSKMYGLAGLRIGYGIARENVVELLNRVREPFNVNSLAQAAAMACLKDQTYYKRLAVKIREQRQYLYDELSKLELNYLDSFTNFIMIDTKRNARQITQQLLKRGVIVRDMSGWGMARFIRVTIGTQKENQRFVSAFKDII